MSFYTVLEHPTSLKIKVLGKTLSELFANAASAMAESEFVFDKKEKIKKEEKIEMESIDTETLLVDFLSEILCLSGESNLAYYSFKIEDISDNKIKCRAGGIIAKESKIGIKAVAYGDVNINKTPEGYEAVILFDI